MIVLRYGIRLGPAGRDDIICPWSDCRRSLVLTAR